MKPKLLFLLISLCLGVATASHGQRLRWTFSTDGNIFSSPIIENETAFFGSGDGFVYAVDTETGDEIWRFETQGAVHSTPYVDDGLLYIGSHDGKFYALSTTDGAEIWSFSTNGEQTYGPWDYYLSSPVVAGDLVLFGSGDNHVYALDKRTGRKVWAFATGDIVHASPVVSNGIVYIGSFDGFFYALDVGDGRVIWTFDTIGDRFFPKGEVQKAALVRDGAVYFGSRDYNLYALDADTGKGLWNMKERGSWIIASPLYYRDRLYFGTSDSHTFYALGADYGDLVWKLPLNMRAYGSAIVAGETLFFGCFNGKLYAVQPDTGEVLWTFQTQGSLENYGNVYNQEDEFNDAFKRLGSDYEGMEAAILSLGSILSTPAVKDDTIYFGSADGRLYAVRMD